MFEDFLEIFHLFKQWLTFEEVSFTEFHTPIFTAEIDKICCLSSLCLVQLTKKSKVQKETSVWTDLVTSFC